GKGAHFEWRNGPLSKVVDTSNQTRFHKGVPMPPLRQCMIDEMRLRNFSPETERIYLHYKCMLQYARLSGVCTDCGNIALQPMERPTLSMRPNPGGNPD